MGCRILADALDGLACFYCSTSGVAFGPIMDNEAWAEAFAKWLPNDARTYSVNVLVGLWSDFKASHFECEDCGAVADQQTCPDCTEYAASLEPSGGNQC